MIYKLIPFLLITWKTARCSLVIDSVAQRGIYVSDYCPKMPYCPEGAHVMCMQYDPHSVMSPRCHNAQNVSMNTALANQLVDVSNAVRAKIASGKETGKDGKPLPRGYGIFRLKWDNELATFAQVWANQCLFRHDLCRATKRFPNPGQTVGLVRYSFPDWIPISKNSNKNSNATGLTVSKLVYAVTMSLKSWYAQKNQVTEEMIRSYPDWNLNPTTGGRSYLETIYGTATHMGCGMSAYTEYAYHDNHYQEIHNSIQLVCNYSARPNKGGPIYNVHPPLPGQGISLDCGCPLNTDQDEDCLCIEQSPVTPEKPIARLPTCPRPDGDCETTLVLLPIFTVEDAPPSKLIEKTNDVQEPLKNFIMQKFNNGSFVPRVRSGQRLDDIEFFENHNRIVNLFQQPERPPQKPSRPMPPPPIPSFPQDNIYYRAPEPFELPTLAPRKAYRRPLPPRPPPPPPPHSPPHSPPPPPPPSPPPPPPPPTPSPQTARPPASYPRALLNPSHSRTLPPLPPPPPKPRFPPPPPPSRPTVPLPPPLPPSTAPPQTRKENYYDAPNPNDIEKEDTKHEQHTSKITQRRLPKTKKNSIFTRVALFKLPGRKNMRSPFSIVKKDVVPRKNFSNIHKVVNDYLNRRSAFRRNSAVTVNPDITEKPDIEITQTAEETVLKEEVTETILNKAEEKVINFNQYLKQKENISNENKIAEATKITSESLMALLDTLETTVKHYHLDLNDKELFDARIRKIYGIVAKRKAKLLNQSKTINNGQSVPENEITEIENYGKHDYGTMTEDDKIIEDENKANQDFMNRKRKGKKYDDILDPNIFSDLDKKHENLEVKNYEVDHKYIDDLDHKYNENKYSDVQHKYSDNMDRKFIENMDRKYNENLDRKYNDNYDTEDRKYSMPATRNQAKYEHKNINDMTEMKHNLLNSFEEIKYRNFDKYSDRETKSARGTVYRSKDDRKFRSKKMQSTFYDDPLSLERRKYYQDKIDNLERKLQKSRNFRRRIEHPNDRQMRRMRPSRDGLRIRARPKAHDSFYMPERARFLHGFR